MDGALQESEITAAKQHHMMLLKKKKAERKNNADAAFNEWTRIVTLDSIVLSADCESIESIDSKPLESWNMKHLRALCSKFKISGYKNRRRDEMVSLLLGTKKERICGALETIRELIRCFDPAGLALYVRFTLEF